MLRELKNVRQIDGENFRRWFVNNDMELILWYDAEKKLEGFQICYDNLSGTRTVVWKRVDVDGKTKSVLTSDGPYNRNRLLALVQFSTDGFDDVLRSFILNRLKSHGG